MPRWEIWRGRRFYWLERANGRHEYAGQVCVASFDGSLTWQQARQVAELIGHEVLS